jgi:hypothetical protein
MPQEISFSYKTLFTGTATTEITFDTFLHVLLSFLAKIAKRAGFLLEPFKNQPTVPEFPALLAKTRQLE